MPSRPPDQEKFHRKSARDKLMDFLARRDHSELELRQKLGRDYPTDEVDMAIELARTRGWLLAPEALAERVTEQLNRKNKGTRYIQKFLKLRGLPFLARDSEQELEKARTLTKSKFGHDAPYSYEEQKKIGRYLVNRGFDEGTIRKVMYEKS